MKFAAVVAVAAGVVAGCADAAPTADPPWRSLAAGTSLGGETGGYLAYSARGTTRFAQLLQPAGRQRLAQVDFRRNAVAAAFWTVPSGGHRVRVVDVRRNGKRLVLAVRVVTPGPGCITTQALVTHYHVVLVPKASLHAPRPTSAVVRKRAEVAGPPC